MDNNKNVRSLNDLIETETGSMVSHMVRWVWKEITIQVQHHEHLRRREDKQNGEDRESSRADQWRNLSNDGKREPNHRLTKK